MLPIWLLYILPVPVMALLVLLPGVSFRDERSGKRRNTKLQVKWPWWSRSKTLAEALHMPGAAEIEFNPPKTDWVPKPAEFD